MIKRLTYKQSVELVLTHLKATKNQWKSNGAIRRPHYFPIFTTDPSPREYNLVQCCPITSLANRTAGDFNAVGNLFKLNKKAMDDIISAADNSLDDMKFVKKGAKEAGEPDPYTKSVRALRRRMNKIFKS